MKVKMLKTERGCDVNEQGITLPVKTYKAGMEYEVGESLGRTLCDQKVAEPVGATKVGSAQAVAPKKGKPSKKG